MVEQMAPEPELKVKKNRQRWVGTLAIIAAIFFSGAVIGWVANNKLTLLVSQSPVGSVEAAPFREDRDPVYAAALSSCTSHSLLAEEAEDVCRADLDASFARVDHESIDLLDQIKQLFKE